MHYLKRLSHSLHSDTAIRSCSNSGAQVVDTSSIGDTQAKYTCGHKVAGSDLSELWADIFPSVFGMGNPFC